MNVIPLIIICGFILGGIVIGGQVMVEEFFRWMDGIHHKRHARRSGKYGVSELGNRGQDHPR